MSVVCIDATDRLSPTSYERDAMTRRLLSISAHHVDSTLRPEAGRAVSPGYVAAARHVTRSLSLLAPPRGGDHHLSFRGVPPPPPGHHGMAPPGLGRMLSPTEAVHEVLSQNTHTHTRLTALCPGIPE